MRHRRGRPPRGFLLARGIHRTLLGFLLAAATTGAAGATALHLAMSRESSPVALGFVALAVVILLWPLAWFATFRIARPVRELADVAREMRHGHLGSRHRLSAGSGEVGEVADALGTMADRVAKQLTDQRALLAAVSHELRSPLARARVLVEMAREGSAPPSVHDDLQAEIDAMDALVGDLLAAARIDFEAFSPRSVAVADLARRALDVARLPPERLVRAVSGTVEADPTLAGRALAGLLDNALRYGAREVSLVADDVAGAVRFTVEDDGPGFAEGELARAFEPFRRGPDQVPGQGGVGLGLALVRQIAVAHGGTAGAENRPSGGARVWIELPRSPSSGDDDRPPSA